MREPAAVAVAKKQPEKEDFSPPFRYPFLIGVYMATNAIPDAYTVVDGPDCLFFKTEYIHGKHDVQSTLLDVFGNHRICLTNVNAGNVAKSHGDAVLRKIKQVDALPNSSVIFVSSLPMVTIIGTQYDTLVREAQPETGARLIDCPGRSLQGDWLTGYSDMLVALAQNIDVSGGVPDPKKVAVVGYLMDRTEGDHTGNIRELERLTGELGLDLTTVWLSGQPYGKLCDIRDAGTILSFPLGRKAAKAIATRTGAKVIEVDIPFGLSRTRRFLDKLSKATGTESLVDPFVDRELRQIVPRLEWVAPHVFIGRRIGFSGPADLLGGFVEIAQDLGVEVVHLSAPCAPHHFHEDVEELGPMPPILFEPKQGAIHMDLERVTRQGLDLMICNSELRLHLMRDSWEGGKLRKIASVPNMEFGFPSFYDHALAERPFLGFRGWLSFVDRMANTLMASRDIMSTGESSESRGMVQ